MRYFVRDKDEEDWTSVDAPNAPSAALAWAEAYGRTSGDLEVVEALETFRFRLSAKVEAQVTKL